MTIAPLNLRARSTSASKSKPNLLMSQSQKILGLVTAVAQGDITAGRGASRNSLTRLSRHSGERTWAPEPNHTNDYSSSALVKEIQTIDEDIKKDFHNLEARIVRNLKRNLDEDDREVRYHRIWFRPKVFVSKDRENLISCKLALSHSLYSQRVRAALRDRLLQRRNRLRAH